MCKNDKNQVNDNQSWINYYLDRLFLIILQYKYIQLVKNILISTNCKPSESKTDLTIAGYLTKITKLGHENPAKTFSAVYFIIVGSKLNVFQANESYVE